MRELVQGSLPGSDDDVTFESDFKSPDPTEVKLRAERVQRILDPPAPAFRAREGKPSELLERIAAGLEAMAENKERGQESDKKEPDRAPMTQTKQTLSILFLDVKGFSALQDHHMPDFVDGVLGLIMKALKEHGVEHKNTWGDGVVATFSDPEDAAKAALDIQHRFRTGKPREQDLQCRISLNSGRVQILPNPITGIDDIYGRAVTFAARLEPKTAVGHIFCSEVFAGLLQESLAAQTSKLPKDIELKDFGPKPVHVVYRPGDPDPTTEVMAAIDALNNSQQGSAPTPSEDLLDDNDALWRVEPWLNDLNGEATYEYAWLEAHFHLVPGAAKKVLEILRVRGAPIQHGTKTFKVGNPPPPYRHDGDFAKLALGKWLGGQNLFRGMAALPKDRIVRKTWTQLDEMLKPQLAPGSARRFLPELMAGTEKDGFHFWHNEDGFKIMFPERIEPDE
jgi:class 3 adenylate cyclase